MPGNKINHIALSPLICMKISPFFLLSWAATMRGLWIILMNLNQNMNKPITCFTLLWIRITAFWIITRIADDYNVSSILVQ